MAGHYMILGRAVKNEHFALGVLATAFGGAWLASAKKSTPPPRTTQEAVASVPINAASSEEEEFIKQFIAEAEKESKH